MRVASRTCDLRSRGRKPWSVPRDWAGETCAIFGGGSSLTKATCDRIRGRARTIAVNNTGIDTLDSRTGELLPAPAPWADVLYSGDAKWWYHYRAAMDFSQLKLSTLNGIDWPQLRQLALSPRAPYDPRPTHVVSGGNSGYQAIQVAAHFGVSRILLFGFDMQGDHWFGKHPITLHSIGKFKKWIPQFMALVDDLKTRGVDVINCTPGSALRITSSTLEAEFGGEDGLWMQRTPGTNGPSDGRSSDPSC